MSAFDIPKNLLALLGALTLAALFATAQPAQAGETSDAAPTKAAASPGAVAHHIEPDTLRKLLSAPRLSLEERHQLLRELNEISEETA